jgi:hypothetical protein
MNTRRSRHPRHIDTIVDDELSAEWPRGRHGGVAEFEKRPGLETLRPYLDERGPGVEVGAQEIERCPPGMHR